MGSRESATRRVARGRSAADPIRRAAPRMVRRTVQAETSAGEVNFILGILVGLIIGATFGVLVASVVWAGREP